MFSVRSMFFLYSIILLAETHLVKGATLNLPGYTFLSNAYSDVDCTHPRGGVACFIHSDIAGYVTHVDYSFLDQLWISFSNCVIGVAYIPPYGSKYLDSGAFVKLSEALHKYGSKVKILAGDLNGRVGDNKFSLLPGVPTVDTVDNPLGYCRNVDQVTNTNGRKLIDTLSDNNMLIVNDLCVNNICFRGD